MKTIIQVIITVILFILIIFFYKIYFNENKSLIKINQKQTKNTFNEENNNYIKNLMYEIIINEKDIYQIKSELGEILNNDDSEIIKMSKVIATIKLKNNDLIFIEADEANFDSLNYNTEFRQNVKINYINNKIVSDKMIFDVSNNFIKIFKNVEYIGEKGKINTDNIKINLLSKEIDIYMNNTEDNVVLFSK